MHSYIFEITNEKLEPKDWILPTILDKDYSIDYCDSVDDKERIKAIKTLVTSVLPEDVFTLYDNDTIVCNRGIKDKENGNRN